MIFESLLTTFEASFFIESSGAISKIGLSLKLTTHSKVMLVPIFNTSATKLFKQEKMKVH